MKTKLCHHFLHRWACTALVIPVTLVATTPASADDWEHAQTAFSELKDHDALNHLRRAALAGDMRAQASLSLALRHGSKLFPGVLKTDLPGSERWRLAVGAGPRLPASVVPANKRTRSGLYLNAVQAWMMKEAAPDEVFLLDIRSRAEATYVGMPTPADALVPFREHQEASAEWNAQRHTLQPPLNPDFAAEVAQVLQAKGLGKDTRLILICRSGDRSAAAAELLHAQGYSGVHTVVDGFEGDLDGEGRRAVNGWKNAQLPWTYQLQKGKLWVGLK